jgi:hypothetical protein
MMVDRWTELGEYLIAKYNDGYVQGEEGRPAERGYPESWLKRVLESRPDQFKLPEQADSTAESRLVD